LTSITIGPSLTGLRGTQLTGSIIYTLVNERLVCEKAKKYAAKDDDMHRDQGDRGDDAKYREGGGCGESTGCRVLEIIKLPRTIASKKFTLSDEG
jgi:hypothetical protein